MKKLLLVFIFIGSFISQLSAQNIAIVASPSIQCYTGTNTLGANVQTTPVGTSHYSWTVINCSGTSSTLIPISNGNAYSFSQTCCGATTIMCAAWDYTTGTPAQLGSPSV